MTAKASERSGLERFLGLFTDVHAGGPKVAGVDIPTADNEYTQYPIAVVRASKSAREAQRFARFVLSSPGRRILRGYGFLDA